MGDKFLHCKVFLCSFILSITVSFPKVIHNLTIFQLGVTCCIHILHTQFSVFLRLFLLAPAAFWVWTLVFLPPTPNFPSFCDSSSSRRLLFGCGRWFSAIPHPIFRLFATLFSRTGYFLGGNSSFPTSHTQFSAFSWLSLLEPNTFWVGVALFRSPTPNPPPSCDSPDM